MRATCNLGQGLVASALCLTAWPPGLAPRASLNKLTGSPRGPRPPGVPRGPLSPGPPCVERAEGGRLQPGATAGGPQARVPGRRPSRTLAGDRAPRATERSGRAPRAAPTHPFSWGAVWACVSLDTGMNRSVSLGLDRPEPRGGGQAEHGAHLVASLAFLSGGSWLSRLSLRGQALIHLRPPVPAALPGSGLPGPGPPGPAVAGGGGGHLPHLRGALCSPASQAPRQLQAPPGKTRRVGHAQPVLGQ